MRPGQGRWRDVRAGRGRRLHLHLQALAAHQLHARAAMKPPAPVLPEKRSRSDDEGMRAARSRGLRLSGGAALPLTLLAQGASAATADAGRIDHAQAPVGFSAPLLRHKRLPCRTAQRSIWLEGKVSPREAASFPGQGHGCRPIPLWGRRRVGSFLLRRQVCRSKLSRTYRIRMQLMAQFQAEVPHRTL
jgi:hypothetical protein